MSRTYTKSLIEEDLVITPDQINKEVAGLSEQYNRNLDSHNLPTVLITGNKFIDRELSNEGSVYLKSTGSFSDWYSAYDKGADDFTPQYSKNLRTNTLDMEWNKLSDDNPESLLDFQNLKEGIIVGKAVVDWERRASSDEDRYFWVAFGVFLDGVLISESGRLWPRRYTLSLPFYCECPTSNEWVSIH